MAQTKVACLLADGFEDSEFRVPYDAMKQAGIAVDIIGSSAGQQLAGERGKERVKADVAIDQVEPDRYQALFIPGGFSPDRLRADERFVEFVRKFDALGRPVAAVCHGPQLLMAAKLVKGRTLTAWKTVREDLELAGVRTKDEPVVRDGNWITSRQPSDLPAFSEALLSTLH
ncbi:MAG: type 1 glutamine amidotransferase domain-containing protein [Myxococcales bacterium]